ncbi:putative membrane protein [Paraburkholderia sp. WC7.3d]
MSKSSPLHSLQSGSKFGPDAGIGELDNVSVVTENGKTLAVSRYADDVWDFWPYFEQSNVQRSAKRISWASLSSAFVPGVKDVIFRYWIAGLPGRTGFVALRRER